MDSIVSIAKKGKTLYVANHPSSKKERVKLHPSRKKAHVFSSSHSAKNVRDGLLSQGARLSWV